MRVKEKKTDELTVLLLRYVIKSQIDKDHFLNISRVYHQLNEGLLFKDKLIAFHGQS